MQTKDWESKNVLVMSPTTHYWLGRCESIDDTHIHLSGAAWVSDIGRHHKVLETGNPDERTQVEPHPDGVITSIPLHGTVIIGWPHDLWRKVV